MTLPPITDSTQSGTLLRGERRVLELIATGACLPDVLAALCRVIDEESGLMSSVYLLDRDGRQITWGAGPNVPEAWHEATKVFAATPTAGTCGAAASRREPVAVVDIATSPLLAQWRDVARASHLESVWSTPFFSKDGDVLGTFAMLSHEAVCPDAAQRSLVDHATHLASIAVERHQTDKKLRENERLLRLVLDALPVSVVVVDVNGDIILSNPAARQLCGQIIRDGRERYARARAWWHDTGKELQPADWGSVRAVRNGETSVNELMDIEAFDGVRKIVRTSAVPIRDNDGQVSGAVIVNEDISARAMAERERDDGLTQMRTLTGRLMRAQDDERRRIAQLLHETAAQDLAALKMHLARLVRTDARLSGADRAALNESIELAERSMSGIRTLSYLLHPPFLDEAGLLSAFRWYAAGFAKRSGIEVDVDLPATLERLPQNVETALFRVVQEALINIHHHADSATALIRLRVDNHSLLLEIVDRGRGMSSTAMAQLPAGGGALGVGVAGMRERLQQLGGTFDIESTDQGTTVRARVPLSPDAR